METNSYLIFPVPFVGDYEVSYYNGQHTISATITVDKVGTVYNPTIILPFSTATDEQIANMINLHYTNKIDLSTIWSVGDTRTINLSSMSSTFTYSNSTYSIGESHEAQTQELVILDFNHDTLNTAISGHTKAAVSLQLKDCLNETGYIDSSSQNKSYTNTDRYKWINGYLPTSDYSNFFKAIPSPIRNTIKYVQKSYSFNSGNQYYYGYTWLPSITEVTDQRAYGSSYKEGTQYTYYKTIANRIKKVNGSNSNWWTSSLYAYDSKQFFCMLAINDTINNYSLQTIKRGISPGFCL